MKLFVSYLLSFAVALIADILAFAFKMKSMCPMLSFFVFFLALGTAAAWSEYKESSRSKKRP